MDQQDAQDEVGGAGRDALESFTIVRPTTAGRFVFASPHSGRFYPSDLGADPTLPEASLRSAEDAMVDRLIASGPALGAVLVLARIGRAYIDLNRALYWDEAAQRPGVGWKRAQKGIERVIADLLRPDV
jgi:N-formylglutamate amidohydrolase